jgi:hypothetical protein
MALSQVNLLRYISDVRRQRQGDPEDGWESVRRRDVPQQDNTCDCGYFMLTLADFEVYSMHSVHFADLSGVPHQASPSRRLFGNSTKPLPP